MNTREDLRTDYYLQTGEEWLNSQNEPDIDYVDWLEKRIVTPDSKAVIMPTFGEVYKEAEWRATNGHGAIDDYSMSIFINACEWFRSQVREVELKSILRHYENYKAENSLNNCGRTYKSIINDYLSVREEGK